MPSKKNTRNKKKKNRVMASEAETETTSTPKLPLFSAPPMLSPEPSGMLTPPLQTSASVPFHWEEEPGKPRPCTALITLPIPTSKCLELQLPPRLQQMDYSKIITKAPSPTTVFDGPYVGKTVFSPSSSSSFRFSSKRQDSFDSRSSERFQIGAVLLEKRSSGRKGSGLFGSWAQKPKKPLKVEGSEKETGEGSFVISPNSMENAAACDDESDNSTSSRKAKMTKIGRNGSFLSISHEARSDFWATMLEGLKQLVPWKNRKTKKQALIN